MFWFQFAFENFLTRRRKGATAVEYGLLVALIAAVIVATVASIGTAVEGGFTTVLSNL
jgi:pilus assembly protein Flp/PilA